MWWLEFVCVHAENSPSELRTRPEARRVSKRWSVLTSERKQGEEQLKLPSEQSGAAAAVTAVTAATALEANRISSCAAKVKIMMVTVGLS